MVIFLKICQQKTCFFEKSGSKKQQSPKTGKSPGFFQKSFITRLQELGLSWK